MTSLQEKIAKSKLIIKKAVRLYGSENLAIAWKGGKDTTTMMHIILTEFNGVVPFPVMFNDTTLEFKEVYHFIEELSQKWRLNLIIEHHSDEDLKKYYASKNLSQKKELARIMKINSLNRALAKNHFTGYMLGIRSDEHPSRAKEKYFSKRNTHIRVHPMLHFTEADIWDYIKLFNVPYLKLYDQGYRSIGEKPFTKKSNQSSERSGRDQDKEAMMEKLRQMGYW